MHGTSWACIPWSNTRAESVAPSCKCYNNNMGTAALSPVSAATVALGVLALAAGAVVLGLVVAAGAPGATLPASGAAAVDALRRARARTKGGSVAPAPHARTSDLATATRAALAAAGLGAEVVPAHWAPFPAVFAVMAPGTEVNAGVAALMAAPGFSGGKTWGRVRWDVVPGALVYVVPHNTPTGSLGAPGQMPPVRPAGPVLTPARVVTLAALDDLHGPVHYVVPKNTAAT
jgi:hypothetical protein